MEGSSRGVQVVSEVLLESPTVWYVGTDDIHMRIPLLMALRERGFEVGAVGSEDGDNFAPCDIPYWRYSLKRRLSPVGDLRSAVQLYSLFRKHKPDIVHAFDTKPIILGPLLAKEAGVRGRVRTVTGMGYVFSSNSLLAYALRPIYQVLQKWAANSTDMTVFQNPHDRNYFLKKDMVHARRHALVLGSGIDREHLTHSLPRDELLSQLRNDLALNGRVVVTMVSRLVKTKGVREYLKAARIVRQHLTNVSFLLVGPVSSEGRQAVSLRELNKATDVVHYLGQRQDVPALLALTDIFVLPSHYREGVPRVLLEAGAMGLPLITTDMPGCREAVRDGWNGCLVPPRDVAALSQAILRLARSNSMRTEMGARSKAHLRHFDLAIVADRYAEFYRHILASDECNPQQKDYGANSANSRFSRRQA